MRIGLFGGSFDPIHHGHLLIARAIAEQESLQRILVLPTADPPHKDATILAAAQHRCEMIRLAIAGDSQFELSDFDAKRPGPTYTIETVAHFQRELGAQAELHWIIGADSLAELGTWHRLPELVDRCRILTAARPHALPPDWSALSAVLSDAQIQKLKDGVCRTPQYDISATELRARRAGEKSIRYLAPPAVVDYIENQRLYTVVDRGK